MCKAQSPVYIANNKYIDSVEQDLKMHFCNGTLMYPDKYKKKEVGKDVSIITFLNKIYQEDFTEAKLSTELKELANARVSKSERNNGLIKIIQLIINGNYIRCEVTLEFIDGNCFRKFYVFNTTTSGRCDRYGTRVLDFKLLKNLFLSKMNFLIGFKDNSAVVSKVVEKEIELSSKKFPDYTFSIPKSSNENWVNEIYYNQYNSDSSCCYSYLKGHKSFIALLKTESTDIIKNLLYSPNYFYSIHAMEALIYLASINKVVIDDTLKKKITSIKQANYQIKIQKADDVFMTVDGYREINTSDEAVIKKYRNSLQ